MGGPSTETVRVIDSAGACPEIPIVDGAGNAKVVLWPGNGAEFRTMQVIRLEDGAATIALTHPVDCVYYVAAGAGQIVDLATGAASDLAEGAMVHIDAGDGYKLRAAAGGDLTVLGGPCPADPGLYSQLASA